MRKLPVLQSRISFTTIYIFLLATKVAFAEEDDNHRSFYIIPIVIFSLIGVFIFFILVLCRCLRRHRQIKERKENFRQERWLVEQQINGINRANFQMAYGENPPRLKSHEEMNYQREIPYAVSSNNVVNTNPSSKHFANDGTTENLKYFSENCGVLLENCSICLDTECNVVLSCGHPFHLKCISDWFKRHKDCPNCRKPMSKNEMKRFEI